MATKNPNASEIARLEKNPPKRHVPRSLKEIERDRKKASDKKGK